jgi:hypothetical protein
MLRHAIRSQTLAIVLAGIVCGGAARAGDGQPALPGPWIAVARGNALAILELRTPYPNSPGSDTLRYCQVENAGDRLAPQDWRDVAAFERSTGAHLRIAAYPLSTGKWAVVKSELPGGSRDLQYLVIDDPSTLQTPVDQQAILISDIRLIDQKPDERPRLRDVSSARIAEHGGQVYLIGESYLEHSPPNDYAVWVAPAKPVKQLRKPGSVLNDGRIIGYGQEPRVVTWNDRFVVTTQVQQPSGYVAWGKTVTVYESADLESWKPMTGPDAALEFYGYELTVSQGKLTLVGVVDTSVRETRPHRGGREEYLPPLALVTLTYDPDKGAWQETSRKADSSLTTKSEVKLLPMEVTGGALKLIRRATDGTYTISPVAQ